MLVLQIAGGILIAAAVLAIVVGAFRNPEGTWETLKGVGTLACAIGLIVVIWLQIR